MPTVTKYFRISSAVDFCDVDVYDDTRLFVDPFAIRIQKGPRPFSSQANAATKSFFDEISRCALSSNNADSARGLALLQQFKEPRETRLGMAARGADGHGGGEDVGSWIWHVLTTDAVALLRVGLLKWIEDVPIFVRGVGNDITSDLTTRIVFQALSNFTEAQVNRHAQLNSKRDPVQAFSVQVWDTRKLEWTKRSVQLPTVKGKPLVLVPKGWVQPNLMLRSGRFYDTELLSFVQDVEAVTDPKTGKRLKTSKKSLKRRADLKRGVDTNLRVTLEASELGDDILDRFRSFARQRFVPTDG